jgi:hypothetical protein
MDIDRFEKLVREELATTAAGMKKVQRGVASVLADYNGAATSARVTPETIDRWASVFAQEAFGRRPDLSDRESYDLWSRGWNHQRFWRLPFDRLNKTIDRARREVGR